MTRSASPPSTGIASLGLALPELALEVGELARLRGTEAAKYRLGLGCREMALCPPGDHGVVELATRAAQRALERWSGDRSRIGLLAVGTESAVDMSRPLSAWVAERLGLRGAIRSYEVKHACYGGTLALRQAVEWRAAHPAADPPAALVIAADVALYAPRDPGEPTQGAGAVAMVVEEPSVAAVEALSFPWSEPELDFWRPVGEDFPRVDGPLSLDCYGRAAERCFAAMVGEGDARKVLGELAAIAFHVPFPRMVEKTVNRLGAVFGWTSEETAELYATKVEPTMEWNRQCGNAYTASLWIAVANALRGLGEGQRIAAFSYGSGFGAELCRLSAGPLAAAGEWVADVERDLGTRRSIDAEEYVALRGEALAVVA